MERGGGQGVNCEYEAVNGERARRFETLTLLLRCGKKRKRKKATEERNERRKRNGWFV